MRKAEVRASRLATNVVWLYDSSPVKDSIRVSGCALADPLLFFSK